MPRDIGYVLSKKVDWRQRMPRSEVDKETSRGCVARGPCVCLGLKRDLLGANTLW